MRRVNVLHIIDSLKMGGTENRCLEIVEGLHQDRFNSYLVYFNGKGPLSERLVAQALLLIFDCPTSRHVAECKQDRRIRAVVVNDLSSIQQHRPSSDTREIMLDLKAIHGGLFGYDRL